MSDLDTSIKYMFDTRQPGADPGTTTTHSLADASGPPCADPDPDPDPGPPGGVPLERLEAQICELAGHLTAATCRFLVLLGDFDARRGWESWEMGSCAQWLSWKCQMGSGAAREHVRVARALRDLPVLRAEFGAGRLSYAKIRALTRIATPDTERGLAEIAAPMTASQLDRFARAHRQVSHADDDTARIRRRLTWRFDDDGSLAGTFRLPPLQGAVLLQALRAAAADQEHPHPARDGEEDVPAGTPPAGTAPADGEPAASGSRPAVVTSTGLADALLVIAEAFLAGKIATAGDPEVYQVIVHVGTDALTPAAPANPDAGDPGHPGGVPAGTPAPARPPGHPADPARCHVEDGPAISVTTAHMLGCTAALSWMLHHRDGTILDLGRRRRRPTSAQRRAARERDHGRCRYPGCESRRTDLHHIQHWANDGPTSLDNLINLCKRHHTLIHDRGYLIAAGPGGTFTFYQPDGTLLPSSPPLPNPTGIIEDCHDADITPDTIIPPWYGERLNLDYAIHACFANAAYHARHRDREAQREHQQPDQQEHTPQASPWQPETTGIGIPEATELDILGAIRHLGQKHAFS